MDDHYGVASAQAPAGSKAGMLLRHILSIPFIYALAIPLALLDASVCLYQAVAFRLWGIARVSRREYLILDRHKLAYLNAVQRVNCHYCGYANGVLGFAREVAARTEQYWCPIKHAIAPPGPHARYDAFLDFGNDRDLTARIDALRADLPRRDAKPGFGDVVEDLAARYAAYPKRGEGRPFSSWRAYAGSPFHRSIRLRSMSTMRASMTWVGVNGL